MSNHDHRMNAYPQGLIRSRSSSSSGSGSSLQGRRQSNSRQPPYRPVGYAGQPTRAPMPGQQQYRSNSPSQQKVVNAQPPRVQQMRPIPPPASHQVRNGRRPSMSSMRSQSRDGNHHHHHHHQTARQDRTRANWTRDPCLKTCGIGLVLGIGAGLITAGVGTVKACTYCCRGTSNNKSSKNKSSTLINGGRGGGSKNRDDASDLFQDCMDLTGDLLDCDGCCSGDCCCCCGSPVGSGDCCSGGCDGGSGGGGDCCGGGGGGGGGCF